MGQSVSEWKWQCGSDSVRETAWKGRWESDSVREVCVRVRPQGEKEVHKVGIQGNSVWTPEETWLDPFLGHTLQLPFSTACIKWTDGNIRLRPSEYERLTDHLLVAWLGCGGIRLLHTWIRTQTQNHAVWIHVNMQLFCMYHALVIHHLWHCVQSEAKVLSPSLSSPRSTISLTRKCKTN